MKKFKIILLAMAISAAVGGCSSGANTAPAWPLGVRYEIFVLSFADGNGDGKGDIQGLTKKLDYLKDLGIGGIWLMPIMKSPSYHKYDVSDYKSIHPDYGTPEDFKELVKEAHKRNIRVIIDLVVNHTAADHPWFVSAISGKDSPYRDYYVWAKKDSIREQIAKKKVTSDSDNITQWHAVNGDTLAEHYYGFFYKGMPDLNMDNPKVREEFKDIGKYWLTEMDVDGFRLDAARHIFPHEREADNPVFWKNFRSDMRAIKPDVYLVGEVWADAKTVAPYLTGLPSVFNFDLANAIVDVVNTGSGAPALVERYSTIINYYDSTTSEYLDATFLRNHDQNRVLSDLGNDPKKARVAAGILMTLPGTPYLYYGEELGMLGRKPDEYIREPFLWNTGKSDKAQTSWQEAKFSTEGTVMPLSLQKDDKGSMFQFYKKLIQLRNKSAILTSGKIASSGLSISEVMSFKRILNQEELLVLHNISDVEVTVKLGTANNKFKEVNFDSSGSATLEEGSLVLPAYSTVILK